MEPSPKTRGVSSLVFADPEEALSEDLGLSSCRCALAKIMDYYQSSWRAHEQQLVKTKDVGIPVTEAEH